MIRTSLPQPGPPFRVAPYAIRANSGYSKPSRASRGMQGGQPGSVPADLLGSLDALQRSLLLQLLATKFLCHVVSSRNFVFLTTQACNAIVEPNRLRTGYPFYLIANRLFSGVAPDRRRPSEFPEMLTFRDSLTYSTRVACEAIQNPPSSGCQRSLAGRFSPPRARVRGIRSVRDN